MVSANTIILVATLALSKAVAAQDASAISSALASLQSAVATTDSDVKNFQESEGVNGALSIQSTEANIESAAQAVTTALNSANSLTEADAASLAPALEGVTSAINSFASDLIAKASALISVGTQTIVAGDIGKLSGLTFDLQSAAYKQFPNAAVPVLSSNFAQINEDFTSLASAFSATLSGSPPAAPAVTAAATTSAAETSAAATTAAETSAAETSAAATTTSAAVTTSAAAETTTAAAETTSAAETSSAAPVENSTTTSTAPSVIESSGANVYGVSGVLAVVGAAALLL